MLQRRYPSRSSPSSIAISTESSPNRLSAECEKRCSMRPMWKALSMTAPAAAMAAAAAAALGLFRWRKLNLWGITQLKQTRLRSWPHLWVFGCSEATSSTLGEVKTGPRTRTRTRTPAPGRPAPPPTLRARTRTRRTAVRHRRHVGRGRCGLGRRQRRMQPLGREPGRPRGGTACSEPWASPLGWGQPIIHQLGRRRARMGAGPRLLRFLRLWTTGLRLRQKARRILSARAA
mmetsp:Transcript_16254/g.42756  ORF Transcript_16254/g.42756 Transcript_16254/m.42756 type:complete len:232 (+) Transcript_16254:128-823(+)